MDSRSFSLRESHLSRSSAHVAKMGEWWMWGVAASLSPPLSVEKNTRYLMEGRQAQNQCETSCGREIAVFYLSVLRAAQGRA